MSKAKKRSSGPSGDQLPGLDFLANLTNFDMPDDFDFNVNDDDLNDDELERELHALSSQSDTQTQKANKLQKQKQIRKSNNPAHDINQLHKIDLDNLLRDDEGDDGDDLDEELDEDLENELNELASNIEHEPPSKEQFKQVITQTTTISSSSAIIENEQLKLLEANLNNFQKKLQDPTIDDAKKRRLKRNIDQYESAIKASKLNKPFDYSTLPGYENGVMINEVKSRLEPPPPPIPKRPELTEQKPKESFIEEPKRVEPKIAPPPPVEKSSTPPKTTLEALEQLDNEFKRRINEANESGDTGKARRFERNQKIIKNAMDSCKKGKPFNYAELNPFVPPGFPQLPLEQHEEKQASTQPVLSKQVPQSAPMKQLPPPNSPNTKLSPQTNKTIQMLQQKQKLFKEAALQAKQEGNQNLALQYLKNSKGFDNLIMATENGLPVDLSRMPEPPQLAVRQQARQSQSKLQIDVDADNLDDTRLTGDRNQVYKKLEEHLRNQIRLGVANSQHFTKINDPKNSSKFKTLETESMRDLKQLLDANKQGFDVPRYHFEVRKYEMINCCLDLTDVEFELKIIRGINLSIPAGYDTKSFQTYVKFDFPYPDGGQSDKTSRQYGDCPEFNQEFKLKIERNQKFLRVLNRREIKLEIYQKMGFFKNDKLIATSSIKLQPLETKCVIHDSYDLFEGRKRTSGKIECEMRVKEPFTQKEVQLCEDKWLVIDKIIPKVNINSTESQENSKKNEIKSLEVLNFDRNLIDKQIEAYRDRIPKQTLYDLLDKSEQLKQETLELNEKLQRGGTIAVAAYASSIASLATKYETQSLQHESLGELQKAELFKKRKEIIELEISKITEKLKLQ